MTNIQASGGEEHPIIIIDETSYEAPTRVMTGTELRALVDPPIPETRDLWLEKRSGNDDLIKDHEPIELHTGDRFFTTPRHINPGRGA